MRRELLVTLAFLALVVAGCDRPRQNQNLPQETTGAGANPGSALASKPSSPLELVAPKPPETTIAGVDLTQLDGGDLQRLANRAMYERDYARAAIFQHWYVEKSGAGRYNLSCFLARVGEVDGAFYWLQRTAIEEGVDAPHALRDPDLASLRADPRWSKVYPYILECNRYFETAPIGRVTLILPQGYEKGTPIPAIVWLHGMGSVPEGFVNESVQPYADSLNVAFIGISGTTPRGPGRFVWAEDPRRDAERVRAGLAEVTDRVTVKKGKLVAFGFSQGAQVGLEIAVRAPDEYAGAIVLSPGADKAYLDAVELSPALAQRVFVLSCGAAEHPLTLRMTSGDAAWLTKAGATLIHKTYPDVSAHSFPADFDQRFPEWVRKILKTE